MPTRKQRLSWFISASACQLRHTLRERRFDILLFIIDRAIRVGCLPVLRLPALLASHFLLKVLQWHCQRNLLRSTPSSHPKP